MERSVKDQGGPGKRPVQIAGQKMLLRSGDVLKSITQCHKTKPPTMLSLGRRPRDSSRKQAEKQQSSGLHRHTKVWEEFPAICREDGRRWTLISAVLSAEAESELPCAGRSALASPPLRSRLVDGGPEPSPCFLSHRGSLPLSESMFGRSRFTLQCCLYLFTQCK